MPAAAITAAIITSIAAAGTASATTAVSSIQQKGSGISGTIINESRYSFTVESFDPSLGHWVDHPSNTVASVHDILAMLEDEFKALYPDKAVTDAEILAYYRDHYVKLNQDQPFVRSAVTSWEMKGANWGSEGMIRLQPKGGSDWALYIMIRKKPRGDYGAGISIISHKWMEDNEMDMADDSDGSKMIDHIRQSTNSGPSSYFSDGKSVTGKNGDLAVTFAAAQMNEFVIKDA